MKRYYLLLILIVLWTSCVHDLNIMESLEKTLKINLKSKYTVILDKTENSWRKDVLRIDIKLKINPNSISDVEKQIENSKYFNIKITMSDSMYYNDKFLFEAFNTRYCNKIKECENMGDLPKSYYQKEYLLIADSIYEGHWIKETKDSFVFEEFYDDGIVYKCGNFNKQTGILHYQEWPSP